MSSQTDADGIPFQKASESEKMNLSRFRFIVAFDLFSLEISGKDLVSVEEKGMTMIELMHCYLKNGKKTVVWGRGTSSFNI